MSSSSRQPKKPSTQTDRLSQAMSRGFLPNIPNPKTTTTTATTPGFLDKYSAKSTAKFTSSQSGNLKQPTTTTAQGTSVNDGSPKDCSTAGDSVYDCCFFIPPEAEACPALNIDDICDTCCAPQVPICSENPNCHMFKECRNNNYTGYCKYLRNSGPKIPSWLAYCGRVLTFYGFFQEPVPESDKETYRIRQVLIRFYMDDGTVDVFEPKTFDPGFTQGRLIRRHRIPLPPPADSEYYTIDHFNVGCEVEFYGKSFLICGCSDSTRRYLNKLGISVPHNMELPDDPYTLWRKDRITSLFARKARIDLTQGKFKSFLLNNRKVLRFWAFWDDRSSEDGYLRRFVIHFFLEDDTIEIKEIPFNTRTDVFPTFLNRAKLYKNYKELVNPVGSKEEALLILNTTGGCHNVITSASFLEDRLCPGIEGKEHVKDRDLAIGAVINVYGRAFIITECDEFTKRYYKDKYGIEDFTPLTLSQDETNQFAWPRMETPPHIGIGDEEDTAANWDKIEPVPPKKDELRSLVMDKDILGFHARLVKTQHKVNGDRRFIINYFMADNTMKVFEQGHPNTGMKQGTFLQRCRPRKSETGLAPRYELGELTEYYKPADFYVGNTLGINGFKFLLIAADPQTVEYMEGKKHLFPQANLCLILEKVREAFGPYQSSDILCLFSEKDSCLNGIIEVNDFKELLFKLVKDSLSEHEMMTITRAFKVQADDPGPDMKTLQSVIQTELSRRGYDRYSLQRVEYTLRYHDPCRAGVVDRHTLRSALLAARLPIARDLVDFLVQNFEPGDDCDRVNYCKVIEFLDYVKNPTPKANPTNIRCIMKWLEPKAPAKVFCINYRSFLEEVCPNYRCSLPEKCCPPETCCDNADPCSEEPCKQEECLVFDTCPAPCCEPDERWLAGRVITDNNPWSEQDRCDTQDQCEFPMVYDPYSCKELVGPVPGYLDPCLAKAYQCSPTDQCEPPEGGNKEMLHCEDHIGFEDLYR